MRSTPRTVMGRMGTFAMRAMTDAPAWIDGTRSVLPRRVPSGKMPTSSSFFSMRTARLMEVMSAVSRFTGKAPTRESAWPSRPWALPNSESRPMRRTHWEGRAARYMNTTSKNDVWLQMTSAPEAPLNARSFWRLSTR